MADVTTQDAPPQDAPPQHLDPFGADSSSFEVTSPIDLVRLQHEISNAVGRQVQVVLSVDSPDHVVSATQPAKLFVRPQVDTVTVQEILNSHAPSSPAEVLADPSLTAEMTKLQDGKSLSNVEIGNVLRALLNIPTT